MIPSIFQQVAFHSFLTKLALLVHAAQYIQQVFAFLRGFSMQYVDDLTTAIHSTFSPHVAATILHHLHQNVYFFEPLPPFALHESMIAHTGSGDCYRTEMGSKQPLFKVKTSDCTIISSLRFCYFSAR